MKIERRNGAGEMKPMGLWTKCGAAADLLGLTRGTVNILVRENKIPGKVIAGVKRTRVLVSTAWILSQQGGGK